MLSQLMIDYGNKPNMIRDISAYASKRKQEIGAENVHDFSIGAPNVPAPPQFREAMLDIIQNTDPVELHTYTYASGTIELRTTIANYVNGKFGDHIEPGGVFVTHGSSSALAACIRAVTVPEDEVIVFNPCYMEYGVYIEAFDVKCVRVDTVKGSFQIDVDRLDAAITNKTKAVIVNSPCNPTGVVYTEATIRALTDLLKRRQAEYGHPIFLISDDAYRELVYDDIFVPYLMNYYDNTIVTYTYSKTLSIPGERLGYMAVCKRCAMYDDVVAACIGAARALGHICASNLLQRVITRCIDVVADVNIYKRNRDLLLENLEAMGYTCTHPDGAFYLFVQSPAPDAVEVCNKARDFELILVPGVDFGITDYLRISYCVEYDSIVRALPAFRQLAQYYGLCK